MRADVRHSKQSTFDNVSEPKSEPAKPITNESIKLIEITDITASTKEDELEFKVAFKLLPSRTAFSRLGAELYFDGFCVDSLRLRVLQGPLATDCAEFSSVMDMTGIEAGQHLLRVELCEFWGDERLTGVSREVAFEYVPVKRVDRLLRVPFVKSVAGSDLTVSTDAERQIYRELQEDIKREGEGRKDHW
jgi:hypothetical protein